MDINILFLIISAILAVIAGIFAMKWSKAKALLKEMAEALTCTSDALADDKLSETERAMLLREWADVIRAARNLI